MSTISLGVDFYKSDEVILLASQFCLEEERRQFACRLILESVALSKNVLIYSLAYKCEAFRNKLSEVVDRNFEAFDHIYIDGSCTLQAIERSIERIKDKSMDLIVVDYIELIRFEGETSREIAISKTFECFRQISKKFQTTVLLLGTLSKSYLAVRPAEWRDLKVGDFSFRNDVSRAYFLYQCTEGLGIGEFRDDVHGTVPASVIPCASS